MNRAAVAAYHANDRRRHLRRVGAVSFFDTAAVLDIDKTNGRGRVDGVNYENLAALIAAAGGVAASGVYTIGPYVDPAGANLVVNGDGTTTTGWTAGNGAVASVGGKLELTGGNVTAAYLSQQLTGLNTSRAYRTRQKVTRATGGPGVFAAQAPSAAALAPSSYQVLVSNTEVETVTDMLWGSEQPTAYIGIKQNGVSAGVSRLDDAETREALAVKGLNADRVSIRLQGRMPASVAGTLCLLQIGDDSERNRVRIDSQGGVLHAILTYANVARADITLGTKAANETFEIVVTADQNAGFFMGKLDSGVVQQAVISVVPGLGRLWVGRSFTGEAFGGQIDRVRIYDDWMPSGDLWIEGDSYGDTDALGTSLWSSLQLQTPRRAFKTAIGSSTLQSQRDRVLSHPGFAARNTLIHVDGYANSYGTLAADRAKYADMAAAKKDGRFLFLTPVQPPSGAVDINAAAAALRPVVLADYPNRSFDLQNWVDTHGGASAYQADGIHLSLASMNQLAVDVNAVLLARGM